MNRAAFGPARDATSALVRAIMVGDGSGGHPGELHAIQRREVKAMDTSMIKGIVIGGIAMVVVSAGAVTGYKVMTKPKFADVVSVKEVTETIVTPREECHDVQVQKQAPVKDN